MDKGKKFHISRGKERSVLQEESSEPPRKQQRVTDGSPFTAPLPVGPIGQIDKLSDDLAEGKEKIAIPVYGPSTVKVPTNFTYISEMKYEEGMKRLKDIQDYLNRDECCGCTEGACEEYPDTWCTKCGKYNGNQPYAKGTGSDNVGRLLHGSPLIFECHPLCKCTTKNCLLKTSYEENRKGGFQLFFTGPKGWGVRSSNTFEEGEPVCEYIGEMRDVWKEADTDPEAYYAMNIDGVSRLVNDRGNKRNNEILGYKKLLGGLKGAYEIDHTRYTVDAGAFGNIARFINHSCDPNLFVQNVAYPHGGYHYLACQQSRMILFALKDIPAFQELTFDYHPSGPNKVKCLCGSAFCRKFLSF